MSGGFDWAALPEGGVVVDVGSGVGGMAVELKKHFSHLKYVAQDRQPVIDEAVKVGLSGERCLTSTSHLRFQIFGQGRDVDDLSLQGRLLYCSSRDRSSDSVPCNDCSARLLQSSTCEKRGRLCTTLHLAQLERRVLGPNPAKPKGRRPARDSFDPHRQRASIQLP